MFGLFGSKDWNVIAIIFERKDLYRVNGQRGKGGAAVKCRDGAKTMSRTLFWAVYDQKRAFIEGEMGPGAHLVTPQILQRLKREINTNMTVQQVLGMLEKGETAMAAKPLAWTGYPKVEHVAEDEV
ncbi:MAG: hypothetical protein C0478_18090 [Planctomyces sp.]|nr:hypothetical protein [Planctomyces sp.]